MGIDPITQTILGGGAVAELSGIPAARDARKEAEREAERQRAELARVMAEKKPDIPGVDRKAALRRTVAALAQRKGRESTILTGTSSGALGG